MRTSVNPFLSLPRFSEIRPGAEKSSKPASVSTRDVAKEFESLLLEQMVREMRKATPQSSLLGQEPGHDIFNEMLDGEFVRLMVERGGLGIADLINDAIK